MTTTAPSSSSSSSQVEDESHLGFLHRPARIPPELWNRYRSMANPFANSTEVLTTYEKIKLLFPGCIFVPLRFLAIIGTLGVSTAVAALVTRGLTNRQKRGEDPLPETKPGTFRRWMGDWSNTAAKYSLLFASFYRLRVKGQLDKRANLVVSNHTGPWEAFGLMGLIRCCVVSRIENATAPLIGYPLLALPTIFVSRQSGGSRHSTFDAIGERVHKPPGEFPPLLIFPEGTTANNRALLKFKVGAFAPGAPVQPMFVRHVFKHLDPTWGSSTHGFMWLLMRVCAQWYSTLEVNFLPLYYPSEEEKQDAHLFAENVRKVISEASQMARTEYTVEDSMLISRAMGLGMLLPEAMLRLSSLKALRADEKLDKELDKPSQFKAGVKQLLKDPLPPTVKELEKESASADDRASKATSQLEARIGAHAVHREARA